MYAQSVCDQAPEADLRAVAWGEGAQSARGFLLRPQKKSKTGPTPEEKQAAKEEEERKAAAAAKEAVRAKKIKQGRCPAEGCRKKLKLTAISCACGLRFCHEHRLPEAHECTVDFKRKYQEQLRKDNPTISGGMMADGGRRL